MPVTYAQKELIEAIMRTLESKQSRKRLIAAVFMDLVDAEAYPEYYESIPNPRCLNGIRANLHAQRYEDPLDVYNDLATVFYNAMFFNQSGSTIWTDASILKSDLDNEWRRYSALPQPRSFSPPPIAPQKAGQIAAAASEASFKPPPTPVQPTIARSIPTALSPAPATMTAPTPIHPVAQPTMKISTEPEIDVFTDTDDRPIAEKISEEIVLLLDSSLPKWSGFSESGWWHGTASFADVVHSIKSHKDVIGNRYAPVLESVPEAPDAFTNLPFDLPLSLKIIEQRAKAQDYHTAQDFDRDMASYFLKARRWYDIGSDFYGQILLLQRLYQALTSDHYPPPTGSHYASTIGFAGLPTGPGTTHILVPNTITHKTIPEQDRVFVDEVCYKGWNIHVGDFVHLANANDTCRPIVAQVWKCWENTSSSAKGQQGVTVKWYFRPEQTFHTSDRKFLENEVFLTDDFVEHPLPDIIEKIHILPSAQYMRGRPRAPHWYPDTPTYTCDQQYDPEAREFRDIPDWAAALSKPELAQAAAPYFIFEQELCLREVDSPFLAQGKGKSTKDSGRFPGGLVLGTTPRKPRGAKKVTKSVSAGNGISTIPSSLAASNAVGNIEKISGDLARHFDRDPETNEVFWFAAPPSYAPRPARPKHSTTYLHFLATKKRKEAEHSSGEAKKMRMSP